MPSISVVMSTYKDADHLAASIDSVLAQDFPDFEFVIVNDGSPDPRTGEILADYAARDGRIRVITKPNEGLTKALIDGCAAARGEYIARIDVGDVMTPDRLRRQKAVLDAQPDVVFVSSWTEYCGPQWEHLTLQKGKNPPDDGKGLAVLPAKPGDGLLAGPTCHPSVLMRYSAYSKAGGYRWQFYYAQDWDLWYRLAEQGKFAMVNDILYRVRVLPTGISSRQRARQREVSRWGREAFRQRLLGLDESDCLAAAARIRPGGPKPFWASLLATNGSYFIGEQLRRNRDPRCANYLITAIKHRPWDPRPWIRLVQCALFRPNSGTASHV